MSARNQTPWRAEGRDNGKRGRQRREFWAVLDRNDFFVAEGLDETTAREIVAAVNERDRLAADKARYRAHNVVLRDLVRRFADYAETYHSLGVRGKSLVAEARAALWEATP